MRSQVNAQNVLLAPKEQQKEQQQQQPKRSRLIRCRGKEQPLIHQLKWLTPFSSSSYLLVVVFLAFQTIITQQQQQVALALQQQANSEQQQMSNNVGAAQDQQPLVHNNINLSLAPQISMGSESSSALESSAALAQDDLIAAESAQPPVDALLSPTDHKQQFTNAQVVRQDNAQQQVAASVAPVFVQQPPQQQPQQQQQVQQPPVAANQQQQQQQMFNVHPNHMLQARIHQQKQFNPFMAAALAGNYGPAQQQMAAAAAAAAGIHQQHPQVAAHQQQVIAQQQQQQHHGPQAHHYPMQQVHPMHQQQQPQHNQQLIAQHQHARQVVEPQQQVVAIAQPQQQQQQQQLAVQESTVRQNIVPAPSFSTNLDSNSIELNEPAAHQQPLAAASSVAHSQVVAAASTALAGPSSSALDLSGAQAWPLQAPDIPKIVNLEVKCEKNLMKVSIEFDKVFNGVIFSKGHYAQGQCLHVGQNSGKQQAYFDISINSCGTQGNTQNGLYGMGGNTGSGTYFENTIVVQYDPNVQEVYDHARKLRCTWHDQYEKAVTFRPFPVDMLDIVRADFAGDNVGCWMQIQVGKGPWASEVAGIVKIGQTMTMVLAIKDEENKFDMLVRNCFAHDGKRGPIELVDKSGCITRPKLMSRFTKIKNFGSSATVLSYAHFQAFKFPDSMEVHFQCTIQICRHQCPEQCSAGPGSAGAGGEAYSESTISGTFNIHQGNNNQGNAQVVGDQLAAASSTSSLTGQHLRKFGSSQAAGLSRERRDVNSWLASGNGSHHHHHSHKFNMKPMTQTVGLNRIIQVVSTGDLAFALPTSAAQQQQVINGTTTTTTTTGEEEDQLISQSKTDAQICMSSYQFVTATALLLLILLCSSIIAVSLYLRQRALAKRSSKLLVPHSSSSLASSASTSSSTCSSPTTTMRSQQQQQSVPINQQYNNHLQHHHNHHHQPVLSMFDPSKMH